VVMSTAGLLQTQFADSLTRPPASVVRIAPKAGTTSVVASLPDLELAPVPTNFRGRARTQMMPIRFSRSAMAIAWDTVVATGSGDGYRIDLRNPAGQVRTSICVAIPRRRVTRAMRDSAIATALVRLEGSQAERLVAGASGRTSVKRARASASPARSDFSQRFASFRKLSMELPGVILDMTILP
jgi:hypothetical protein